MEGLLQTKKQSWATLTLPAKGWISAPFGSCWSIGLVFFIVTFVGGLQVLHGQETWVDNDIGVVGIAGSSSYNGSTDTFTVNGAGSGVGGTADSCHLVSESVNGDLELIAHVASIQNTNAAAVSGLMMRESTSSGAISAYMAVTPSDGVVFITRSSTNGGSSTTTAAPSQTAPVWLRLVRNTSSTMGDFVLTGYYSTDGASWTQVGTTTFAMANNVLMGMAVSSHTTSETTASSIDHVDAMINLPQQASNLIAWYRADVGVVQSSGSVSEWMDQSGNGNNANQTTGSKQPALEAAVLNGQPVLHFTHANDTYMTVANASDLSLTQITAFAISRNSGTTSGTILSRISSVVDYVMSYSTNTTPRLYINSSAYYAQGSLTSDTWGMLQGEYDQVHISLYVNGTLTQTAHTTAIGSSTNPLYLGGLNTGGSTADSDLAELLIFNSALTTTQYQQVEGYLYTKYGIGVDPLPVISSSTTATGTVGSSFSYTITASNSPTSFYASGLPTGLSLNTTTGVISGTPTIAGSYQATISATNAAGTGSAVLSLTINSATPVITSSTSAIGVVGQSFGYTITASNSPTSFNATGLPSGLSVNTSNGVISGTPTSTGASSVTISATNATGTGNQTLTLTVNPPAPMITSSSTATGTITHAFSYTIVGTNNPTSYSLTGSIPGLSLNASTGVISGTPTTAGTYPVTIGATNVTGTGTATLTATIFPQYPTITSALTASGDQGSAFSYTITANNSPTSYNATGLPSGLGINTSTGVISGTPSAQGASSVTLSATNSYGTGTATLMLTINPPPPVISSAATASGTVGKAFSYTITGSNSPTSYSVTGLIPGLNVNTTTGLISGTPTAAGTYSATIGATNAGGTGSAPLTVSINAPAPVITSATSASGTLGLPFDYIITANGSPTSFSASGLPSPLTVNTATGVITGTLTTAGNSTVTLGATNAGGTGNATLTITGVTPPAPVITSGTTASGDLGVSFSYTILASNNPTSFSATGLPSGLSVNSATGVISGAPTSTGTSTVTIKATNAGGTGTATLTLTINGVSAPVITSALAGNIFTGTAFSYAITATNTPTSYTASGLPSGLTLNTSTGVISGTPTGSGFSTITVTIGATNSGGTATASLLLTLDLPLPVISSSTSVSGALGSDFSYTITASNNPSAFTATGLPAGLSVNPSSGVISGTPTSVGTSAITIGATNAAGTGTTTLNLAIGSPMPVPVINSGTVAAGSVGTNFSYSITTSTIPAPTSYGATGLPAGLSINTGTGVISGTPTTSNSSPSTVTLSATNSGGSGYATLMLTINPSGAPVITSTLTASTIVGSSFNYTITANNSAVSFSASGLPSALILNSSTGQISGTAPTAAGPYSVILSATNMEGTGSAVMLLTVNPPAPVITSSTSASGTFGTTLTAPYTITASSSPTSFGATNLPPGLIVNAYTGAITGTPTMSGTWMTVISASNAGGAGTANLTFTIAAAGSSPIVTRSVASGDYHSLLLKSDGTVWATGYNGDGELGNGGNADSPSYVQVPGLSGIIAVASGGYTSMALDNAGHVWTWGDNYFGELGSGSTAEGSNTPVEVSGLSGIIAIAGGEFFNMALDNNGHVWTWGDGNDGELGNPSYTTTSNVPVEVCNSTGYLSNITEIASEGYSGMAIRNDGSVWVWGLDNVDQLGDEAGSDSFQAKEVSVSGNPLSTIVSVAGGEDYGFAVTGSGTVWAWGDESDGNLGNGVASGNTASPNTGPVQILNSTGGLLSGVISVSSRGDHSLALLNDGTVWAWGQNSLGQLGNGSTSLDNLSPIQVSNLTAVQAISAGYSHSMALKADGTVWGWGSNSEASNIGAGSSTARSCLPETIPNLSGVTAVAGNKGHYLALTSSGTVWAWNDTTPGDCGNGTTITGSAAPVQVMGFSGITITAIACGAYFNLALDNTGKVWAWGQNDDGQLGNGTNTDSQIPVEVTTASGSLSGITAIACTGYAGLALDGSGHVWAWGDNSHGELGTGNNTNTNLAAQVPSLSGITAVSAGPYQVAALGSGGSVWLWGFNVDSMSGYVGDYLPGGASNSPVNVPSLTGITAISVNDDHDLALTSSGSVLAWGDNSAGELGNGSTTNNSSFTATGLTGVTAIGPGGDAFHALAVKSNGTLWEWGDNTSGQLGVGNYGSISTSPSPTGSDAPLEVLGLNGATITGIALGKYSTVILTNQGTVLQWGDSSYEPLGFSVPVQVADLQAVPPPAISPMAGSYTSSQTISISSTLTGTIHYTLDGTTPTANSPAYSGSFVLSNDALVSAVVINSGAVVSPTASSQYFINDPAQTGLPTVPTGLTVAPASSGQINLSWTLSGTTNYSLIGVYRSSDGGMTYQLIAVLSPSTTSYVDSSVVTGTNYQYYVATINDSGQSDTSVSSSVTPTSTSALTITVTTPSGATPLP